jgi:uncharacterized protein
MLPASGMSFAFGGKAMTKLRVSGIEPGQRRLNGPQSTGRDYRNLFQPTHAMTRDDDVPVPMREGVYLLTNVHRPAEPGRYPVFIAASPYPRQIQDLGAPAGFIEAGASDFFVPRGFVQPWSDGGVGMIGIGYFAGTQMEAAVERPPHLKAIMPIAGR